MTRNHIERRLSDRTRICARSKGTQSRALGLASCILLVAGFVCHAQEQRQSPPGPPFPPPRVYAPVSVGTSQQTPVAAAQSSGGQPVRGDGPRLKVEAPVHDFGRVRNGEVVKHTYVFTNAGNQVLNVTDVRASCGCTTMGGWTRQVKPGETGSIPIQFNTGTFEGPVVKTVSVTCNDPTQPTAVLQIKATVWKPFEIRPQFAVLNTTADSPSKSTNVRIVNNTGETLTLSAPVSSNPSLAAELKTVQAGREYDLVVRTVPPLTPGNAGGTITLQTSSTNHPAIEVRVWANVQQAVMVLPALINLPWAPLSGTMPVSVSIRNNGTNALVLSEPSVNVKGVDVKIKEIQPGRYFTVTASFPSGFKIEENQKVELTVKSNHPDFQRITVPVRQMVRPVSVTAPGPAARPATPAAAGAR